MFVAWWFFIVWVTRVDMRVCARMSMRRCVRVVSAVLGAGLACPCVVRYGWGN